MAKFVLKLDSAGRIVLPAAVRKAMGASPGEDLILEWDQRRHRATLETRRQALARAQEWASRLPGPRSASVVDELIAERRAEAAREEQGSAKQRKAS